MFGEKRKAEDDAAANRVPKLANGSIDVRRSTFARNLTALNSQFAAWVAEQSSTAPKELWTDGVEDYLKYAKQLLADFKDVLESSDKPEAAPAAAGGSGSFAFGAAPAPPAAAGAAGGSAKPPLAPGGLFGASTSQGTAGGMAPAPASIFGALPSTGGAFGLGSTAPAFGGFGGSGVTSAANSGGSGLFNVPSTGTLGSSFNTGAGGAADDEGEEGEEQQDAEPSVQLEVGEGIEVLAKQRVKLLSMNPEKKWKDKGQGLMTLRRATGEGTAGKQPYLVFTTDSGRVLINAPLLKNMKPTQPPKAPATLIMFLISNVDGKEEKGMHMLRCDNADAAKQLVKIISEVS